MKKTAAPQMLANVKIPITPDQEQRKGHTRDDNEFGEVNEMQRSSARFSPADESLLSSVRQLPNFTTLFADQRRASSCERSGWCA